MKEVRNQEVLFLSAQPVDKVQMVNYGNCSIVKFNNLQAIETIRWPNLIFFDRLAIIGQISSGLEA